MTAPLHRMHLRQDVCLDVGTATTRIAVGGARIMEQPSAIGAKRALRSGVVVDGDTLVQILQPLLERARVFGIVKPSVLACAPSDARKEERQLLLDSILKAGAASVSLIPEPLAAAVGAGIDVSSQYAQMVVDIGEGVADCAIIRSSKIRATCAIRIGCSRMRRAVASAAKENGSVSVCAEDAEMLLRSCGLTRPVGHSGSALTAVALQPVIEEIADTIDSFIRDIPPELGCEVIESGICLTGGGALIPGLRDYFEHRTDISVTVAGNPRASVVVGARAILPVILTLNRWK